MTVHEFAAVGIIDTGDAHTRTFLRNAISNGVGISYWDSDEDSDESIVLHATDDEGAEDETNISLDDMAAAACRIIAARSPYHDEITGTKCADIRYLTKDIRDGIISAFLFGNMQFGRLERVLCDALVQVATFGELLYDEDGGEW